MGSVEKEEPSRLRAVKPTRSMRHKEVDLTTRVREREAHEKVRKPSEKEERKAKEEGQARVKSAWQEFDQVSCWR